MRNAILARGPQMTRKIPAALGFGRCLRILLAKLKKYWKEECTQAVILNLFRQESAGNFRKQPLKGRPMSTAQTSGAPNSAPVAAQEEFTCGTLRYTKGGLFILSAWLIWGGICFNLFEDLGGPHILGGYLQDNFRVSNLTVNILTSMIPMLIGVVMTPIISFKSDRCRSRWGRRIPFMFSQFPSCASFP
jgi:hypothetical protein